MALIGITDYQLKIIGTGPKFPDTFSRSNGKVSSNSGVERINQSIKHILGTRIGQRYFVPEFGSRLHELVFEPNDLILRDLLIYYVQDALTKWEPRIKILTVNPEVIKYENTVPIHIDYKLVNTNSIYNYVYPFNREVYTIGGDENRQ